MMQGGVFVVAGATGAIGRTLCQAIVQQGGRPLLVGRSMDKLQDLQSELGSASTAGVLDQIDFAQDPSAYQDKLQTELKGQTIQGLSYAVGSITLKPIKACKPQDFWDSYQLNVLGAASLMQAALPGLKQAANEVGNASVVLFSSVAASRGTPNHSVVASSKGAIEGLTVSWAAELAPQSIRVNCVAPSLTRESAMSQSLTDNEKMSQAIAKAHPLSRLGTPQDSAYAAAYLLSKQSAWTTGSVLPVDGGRSTVLK